MTIKTIPCGGFYYDDENISFEKDEFGRKVLNVTGSSGLDLFVVNILDSDETESGYVADKTYQEINDAYFSGKTVVFNYDGLICSQRWTGEIDGESYMGFMQSRTHIGDNAIQIDNEGYLINADNVVIEYYKDANIPISV